MAKAKIEGFEAPSKFKDDDEKILSESERQEFDWDSVYWKPKPGVENVIRILPGIKGANFHLRFGKHFIKHPDRTETFVCNQVTYGESCLACEERMKLLEAGKREEAAALAPQIRGVFNIVDYSDDNKVKLWEAPPTAVWLYIVKIVRSNSRFSNIVGTDENPLEGRDVIVYYDPDASPQNMYKIQFDSTSELDEELAKKALEEARPLIKEELYPKTPEDVAKIKLFGSAEEREALREKLSEGQFSSQEKLRRAQN